MNKLNKGKPIDKVAIDAAIKANNESKEILEKILLACEKAEQKR